MHITDLIKTEVSFEILSNSDTNKHFRIVNVSTKSLGN